MANKHFVINKIYEISKSPVKTVATTTALIADSSYNSDLIPFNNPTFNDGSWSLQQNNTVFSCNKTGTYQIIWTINDSGYDPLNTYYWLLWGNIFKDYATRTNGTSQYTYSNTETYQQGDFINFNGEINGNKRSVSGTCNLTINHV